MNNVPRRSDKEDSHVTHSDFYIATAEENNEPNAADTNTSHDEQVPVTELVGQPAGSQTANAGDDIDGDGPDLCGLGGPAKLPENGRDEEIGGVVKVDDTEVDQCSVMSDEALVTLLKVLCDFLWSENGWGAGSLANTCFDGFYGNGLRNVDLPVARDALYGFSIKMGHLPNATTILIFAKAAK